MEIEPGMKDGYNYPFIAEGKHVTCMVLSCTCNMHVFFACTCSMHVIACIVPTS